MIKYIALSLLTLSLYGFSWDYMHSFTLKKDKIAYIKVLKRDDSSERLLQFRWTLYQNKRLVLLVKYDDFPSQYILQKEYKRNSIKIALRDDYHDGFKRAYLVLTFAKFDDAKREAVIDAFVADPKKRVEIEFIDSNKK